MQSRVEVVQCIADDIQHWLARNPDAADTPEGIRDFWLSEKNGSQPRELVLEALNQLATLGIVREAAQRQGMPSIYCGASRRQVRIEN